MDNGLENVRYWLTSYNLDELYQTLTDNGFINLQKCCFLDENYLELLHIVDQDKKNVLVEGTTKLRKSYPNYLIDVGPPLLAPAPLSNEDAPPPIPKKTKRPTPRTPQPTRRADNEGLQQPLTPQPVRNSLPTPATSPIPPHPVKTNLPTPAASPIPPRRTITAQPEAAPSFLREKQPQLTVGAIPVAPKRASMLSQPSVRRRPQPDIATLLDIPPPPFQPEAPLTSFAFPPPPENTPPVSPEPTRRHPASPPPLLPPRTESRRPRMKSMDSELNGNDIHAPGSKSPAPARRTPMNVPETRPATPPQRAVISAPTPKPRPSPSPRPIRKLPEAPRPESADFISGLIPQQPVSSQEAVIAKPVVKPRQPSGEKRVKQRSQDETLSAEVISAMPQSVQDFLNAEETSSVDTAKRRISAPSTYAALSFDENRNIVITELPKEPFTKPRAPSNPLERYGAAVNELNSSTIPRAKPEAGHPHVSDLVGMFGKSLPASPPESKAWSSEIASVQRRKNTVKKLARDIGRDIPIYPISGELPENKPTRFIIPHRKKMEPALPARKKPRHRQCSEPSLSSDDTLDEDDGDEDSPFAVHDKGGNKIAEEIQQTLKENNNSNKGCLLKREATQIDQSTSNHLTQANRESTKLRILSDNECKERTKNWESKKGWLWKQGGRKNNKGWKKRWFVFDGSKFLYYQSDKRMAESLSCIQLSNFREVKLAPELSTTKQKYTFQLVTKHREYLLSADSSDDMAMWCSILMAAITQYKPSIFDDIIGGNMNNPDKCGVLKKQGNSRIKDWKERYCAVKDGTFCYYDTFEAFCIATPIASIYCGTLNAKIVERTKFKFSVTVPNRTYYFIAPSEAELMSWVDALTQAVGAALTDMKSGGASAKELIQDIYKEPSNSKCADCDSSEPKWASINLGIVVCTQCSGSHRKLGVHISKVRSLELDVKAWTEDMVAVFQKIGNGRANALFEEHLDTNVTARPPPDADPKTRETFIFCKYERGLWKGVLEGTTLELNQRLMEAVQTDELHVTLALLKSGANVNYIDDTLEETRQTPYLMAIACNQKAQSQLLLLNDAFPTLPETSSNVIDNVDLEGFLEKKGPATINPYKKRKVVLTGKMLRYYDDHSLKNEIDLMKMIDVSLENPEDGSNDEEYHYITLRTESRTYNFRDNDKENIRVWYKALQNTQVFGVTLDMQTLTDSGIPVILHRCILFLERRAAQEGLYRISGVNNRILKLKQAFNQNVHEVVITEDTVVHDVTSAIKLFFRELPESLLAPWHEQLTSAITLDDETERLYKLQDIIYELPSLHFHTLKFLVGHLYKVSLLEKSNKMTSKNLSVIFGPTLMSMRQVGMEYNVLEYQVIEVIIDYYCWLFQVNPETEDNREKEMKLAEEELMKRMSALDVSQEVVNQSWIVEVFHKQYSVNVKVESGQMLRDVSAEILDRTKLVKGDYALWEYLCDGHLRRPIHLSEYLLNTTITLWDERVHKSWLGIDNNELKEKLKMHNFQSLPSDATEAGFLQLCDGKKKWKEVHCKLTNDTLSYSKLPKGLNATSVNLLNSTLYLGAEAKHSSPFEHNFTLRSHHAKEEQMKVYGCRDSYDYWRWIWRIIHVRSKDMDYKLVSSKRASLPAGNNNRNSFIFLDKHSS